MAAKLDTLKVVETPEGVELTLRVAGPLPRGLAWLIDQVIRMVVYSVVGGFLATLGELGMGLFLIFLFMTEWFYPVYFEVKHRGATPGKSLLGLTVVNDEGTPVGWTSSIVRNLLRFADFLPLAYFSGLLSMIMVRDFKRLGDLVAGTVVVYRDQPLALGEIPPAQPVPVDVPLSQEEQRAIIELAERGSGLSRDRVLELAEIVEPLVGGPPSVGATRLLGMAHWLMGRR